MDKSGIERLLKRQKKFFASGKTFDISFRKRMLGRLYGALGTYEKEIGEALKADLGKSAMEAYMCETGLAKSEVRHMLKNVGGYAREKRVRTPLAQYVSRSFIKPVPYGQVLIMSPWNYPLLLSIDPLADALAAGNTCILKPGSYAPATAEVLKRLIGEIFPEEYVAVVTGGRAENAALLEARFDYIFFTGSKQVGREVLAKCAPRLTPVTLELGGKSPCIVDETADLALAAKRIIFGKLLNCGQTCVAPDYIYCAKPVKEKLIGELKKQIEKQYGREPLDNAAYGHIINEKHFDRLTALLKASCETGGRVVCGGQADRGTLKIAPVILDCVGWDCAAMEEEIFGPILPVLSYDRLKEAADEINRRENPLALYLFSSNRAAIRFVKERIQYGGGCINDTIIHLATSSMGFGGVGASGMGAYHGKTGFDTFSHYKSMVDKKTFVDLPIRYQPYRALYFKALRLFVR